MKKKKLAWINAEIYEKAYQHRMKKSYEVFKVVIDQTWTGNYVINFVSTSSWCMLLIGNALSWLCISPQYLWLTCTKFSYFGEDSLVCFFAETMPLIEQEVCKSICQWLHVNTNHERWSCKFAKPIFIYAKHAPFPGQGWADEHLFLVKFKNNHKCGCADKSVTKMPMSDAPGKH